MQLQTVKSSAFNREFNEGLVHQVVTAYMAAGRQGTKAQKTRREVSGGGAKPWKQKGTGRARAGTIRSPLWRKGGIIFAAKPRCYEQKVNRKMYKVAMECILSELIRQDRLFVVDNINLTAPKTRELAAQLKQAGLQQVLIITAEKDEKLLLAARNIPRVEVMQAEHIDPVSLVAFDKVVLTAAALKQVEEKLS